MPPANDRRPDAVARAVTRAMAQAREVAPDLDTVLFTHFPDAETLDTLRPGGDDLETTTAVNRAVASELAGQGVEILVQVADRAGFRRWMDGRADTPGARMAWRDRGRLLRGGPALAALGLDPALAAPRNAVGKSSGSPADRLVRAFADESGNAFDDLAESLITEGRDGVLELAGRKVAERYGEEAGEDYAQGLLVIAEGARMGPAGWAELVALPVALPPGGAPDGAALARGLIDSGALPEGLELRFLPGWRHPDRLAALAPTAIRRLLLELLAGREPTALPVALPSELDDAGFGVLVGLQFDWSMLSWEEIAANGLPLPEPEGEDAPETPEQAARTARFERWRTEAFESGDGCVPLALVPLSEIEAEIADFLEEAGEQTGGLQEIRDFVDMARHEAPDEAVVCHAEVGQAGRLELLLYTGQGRFLDSLGLPAERLPVPAGDMPRLIEAFVPLIAQPPGR